MTSLSPIDIYNNIATIEGPGQFRHVAFCRDGSKFVTNAEFTYRTEYKDSKADYSTVRVWNAHTGELLTVINERKNETVRIAFSNDGNIVATVTSQSVESLEYENETEEEEDSS